MVPKHALNFAVGLLVATFLIGGCSSAKSSARAPGPPGSIDELKRAIADILAKHHVPGVGIALVSKDRVIWTGGIGKADLASGRDVDGDTMFRIGSITKAFVALSILQLQEKGKLSLNDPVSALAPEVPIVNPWEQKDPVRVANLLEHTAGFDDFPLAEMYDFRGGREIPLLGTLRSFPGPQHVRWRPGTLASYSNPGYGVAGYIVEKIGGQRFEQYVADNILHPLGMTHSDFRLTPEVKRVLAQGYEYDPPWPVPYVPILLRSAGELKSSPNEMARFVRMMLNRGTLDGTRIVSPQSIKRMETPQTGFAARNGLKYGYGLGILADISHPFVAYVHDGALDGFLSRYEYLPGQSVGYFFSLNTSQGGAIESAAEREINDLVFKYMTRGMTPPAKPPSQPLDARIEKAAGFYEFASPRTERSRFLTELLLAGRMYIDRGRLYAHGLIPGPRLELIYLGDGQIRTKKDSVAGAVYFTDSDGAKYACGTLGCSRRIDPLWPVTRFWLLAAALVIMASSILFALVWIPRMLLGRMRGVQHLAVRLIPLLAALSLVPLVWLVWNQPAMVLARADMVTMAILVMSIVFPALSITALLITLLSLRVRVNKAVRIHSILVALSCCGISWSFAYWGLIGFRVWAR